MSQASEDIRASVYLRSLIEAAVRSQKSRLEGFADLDADDLVSECQIAVWASLASYSSDRGLLSTWVYRVCKLRLIDLWRSRTAALARDQGMAVEEGDWRELDPAGESAIESLEETKMETSRLELLAKLKRNVDRNTGGTRARATYSSGQRAAVVALVRLHPTLGVRRLARKLTTSVRRELGIDGAGPTYRQIHRWRRESLEGGKK